jgi:hypothetical protein
MWQTRERIFVAFLQKTERKAKSKLKIQHTMTCWTCFAVTFRGMKPYKGCCLVEVVIVHSESSHGQVQSRGGQVAVTATLKITWLIRASLDAPGDWLVVGSCVKTITLARFITRPSVIPLQMALPSLSSLLLFFFQTFSHCLIRSPFVPFSFYRLTFSSACTCHGLSRLGAS